MRPEKNRPVFLCGERRPEASAEEEAKIPCRTRQKNRPFFRRRFDNEAYIL